jgi:ribosomal protein S18 acetylase RimI-like enzyme
MRRRYWTHGYDRRVAVAVAPVDPLAHLHDVYEIYRLALDGEVADVTWFRDTQLTRHSGRDDFVFLGARADGALTGFAYGYTGAYGQWWTDRVGAAMDGATRAEWLDPPHFEVVELHVHPSAQRRGIGKMLLDELLSRQPRDRALLTMNPASPKASGFYKREGWRKLAEVRWEPDAPVRFVLGKRISRSRG